MISILHTSQSSSSSSSLLLNIIIIICLTAPTSTPLNVQVTSSTTSSLTFTWDEIPCGARRGVIEYVYELLDGGRVVLSDRTPSTDINIAGLMTATNYVFRVAVVSVDSGETGPYSQPVNAITSDEGINK